MAEKLRAEALNLIRPGAEWSMHEDRVTGSYELTWLDAAQTKPSDAEIHAAFDAVRWQRIRTTRNKLLRACDWIGATDTQLEAAKKSAWEAYRQALRDVPQTQSVDGVQWPTQPE